MPSTIPQELHTEAKIPEEYTSGFSFLLPKAQKEFLTMEYDEIKFLFQARPKEKGRYIHELWRTGRISVVYEYFVDLERIMQESVVVISSDGEWSTDEVTMDDIAFNTAVMLHEGVSGNECSAFLHDLICASSNAHDNQEFGENPLNSDGVEEMKNLLEEMVSEYSSSWKICNNG